MSTEYYLWTTKAEAEAALTNINGHTAFPLRGKNAATGEPVDIWTTCWVETVVQTVDGRWGFPRIPAPFLDAMGISESERTAWLSAFSPQIVTSPNFGTAEEPL